MIELHNTSLSLSLTCQDRNLQFNYIQLTTDLNCLAHFAVVTTSFFVR